MDVKTLAWKYWYGEIEFEDIPEEKQKDVESYINQHKYMFSGYVPQMN